MLATYGSGSSDLYVSLEPRLAIASDLFAVQSEVELRSPLYNFYLTRYVNQSNWFPFLRRHKTFGLQQVVRLKIERPPYFEYNAGDYVYVNIPHVARFEWHPFTISSAPEDEGTEN
jgi:predicted ferric reductase